jgi:hypothetical protein
MEPEGLLPHSQVPATCPYPESDPISPCPPSHFLKIHLNIILPSMPGSSCSHLSSPPYMLHALLHSPALFNHFWFLPSILPSIMLVLVMSTWNYIFNVMNCCPGKWRNLERLYVFESGHNSFLLVIKVQRKEEKMIIAVNVSSASAGSTSIL